MPPSNQVANDPGMELAETLLSGPRAETPGEQIVAIPRERVAHLPGLISYRVNALVTGIGHLAPRNAAEVGTRADCSANSCAPRSIASISSAYSGLASMRTSRPTFM